MGESYGIVAFRSRQQVLALESALRLRPVCLVFAERSGIGEARCAGNTSRQYGGNVSRGSGKWPNAFERAGIQPITNQSIV